MLNTVVAVYLLVCMHFGTDSQKSTQKHTEQQKT